MGGCRSPRHHRLIRCPSDLIRVCELPAVGERAAHERWEAFRSDGVDTYGDRRDLPAVDGTSRLSPALKWGTIHPRQLLADIDASGAGAKGHTVFSSELAWREFYADVLFRQPRTAWENLNTKMDALPVDTDRAARDRFDRWTSGTTGFGIVDAGMRQLSATGWMHNRVRMITASFLVKDLHLPWQWGARWFMHHLVDGDLASNNHGWQWAAGTGTDAAPYFRVFNPMLQADRYDPDGEYVARWVTQPVPPMLDHHAEREEALRRLASIGARPGPDATTVVKRTGGLAVDSLECQMLDERKTAILSAVVQEYIVTAQPVGSSHIAEAPTIKVSSATVRNEMAHLEHEGYLIQPHTSAGRIPTDKGYRYFVDHLTTPGKLDRATTRQVGEFFSAAHGRLEEMLHQTSNLLAALTNNAGVVVGPRAEAVPVRRVQLVALSPSVATVVAVFANGTVENVTVDLVEGDDDLKLSAAGAHLSGALDGRVLGSVGDIAPTGDPAIDRLCVAALDGLRGAAGPEHVFTGGASAVANAFDAVEVVRSVLATLEQQFVVVTLVSDIVNRGMSVAIGDRTRRRAAVGLLGRRRTRCRRR